MLDITEAHQRLVQELIGQRLPGVTAVAFGSRVHGWPCGNAAKPWSDLDLALFGLASSDALSLAQLRSDLEDSALPWRVDLTDALDLSLTLRALVEQRGCVLQAALAAKEGTPNP